MTLPASLQVGDMICYVHTVPSPNFPQVLKYVKDL